MVLFGTISLRLIMNGYPSDIHLAETGGFLICGSAMQQMDS